MANAAARVSSTVNKYTDTKIYRNCKIQAVTFYPGAMSALDANGQAVKCDDTAGILFDGIVANSLSVEVLSTDTLGDKKIHVERPHRFTMKIASAAATDIGKAVYALYDNEVAFSGLSNSIKVGWMDALIDSTTILVRPAYSGVNGVVGFDGNTLTFDGATGVNIVAIPDNLADALSVSEGSNPYLTFVTTNSNEQLLISKKTSLLDAVDLIFGTGLDALFRWSTGDASDHSLVIGLGDTSQMLHITDKAAIATDWAVTSPTHPTLYIHSNTTPTTDYLLIGTHDGTSALIDVAGGTDLKLKLGGTEYASLRVTGLAVGTYVAAMTAGTDQVTIKATGTAPSGTGANVGHLYADFETDDDELFWLSGTGGTATQLTT